MGFFSTEKQTRVATVVSRVIQDVALPNSVRSGTLSSIMQGGDISDYIMEELVGSIGLKADQMYSYGRDHYTHGLPSGSTLQAASGRPELTAVLSSLEGATALVLYSHYCPPNKLHLAWMKLVSDWGYNTGTNELAVLSGVKGTEVYLQNMTVMIPEGTLTDYAPTALDQWGISAAAGFTPARDFSDTTKLGVRQTPVATFVGPGIPHIKVDYVWEEMGDIDVGDTIIQGMRPVYATFDMPLPAHDPIRDYFHVLYRVGGVEKYWLYQGGLGTYPTLDAVFTQPPELTGTFFPFAYFRYAKASEIEDKSTPAYRTTKKLVKYMGLDFDAIATAIDENPDIDDVEQAMLIMAVPANTENELERRYLFKFFDNLFYSNDNQFATPIRAGIANSQGGGVDINKSALVIQDTRFKMALSNSGITKRTVGGSIGAIGSHTSSMSETTVEQEYYSGVTDTVETELIPISIHHYKKQITSALYEHIQVINLKMKYHVFENYAVTGEDGQDILLIPLDRSITEFYSVPDREKLYSRSLHYVFNSRVIVEIAWYQDEFFQTVMMVVAIFLSIVSLGADGGLFAAIVSGSAAAIETAVLALMMNILQGVLISAALKLFVKAVGGELALVIAIIAATIAGVRAFNAGSIAGAPWAQELLQLSSGLSKAVTQTVQDMYKDLAGEYNTFSQFREQATAELEGANKLLDNKNHLSPFVIFGESPNDFYNRTIHSGNVGINSISAISHYVDTALTLPKFDDTIER